MRLVKIRNKYMFKPKNEKEEKAYKGNQEHIYAVYKEEKSGELRAVQLTHLYDHKRVQALERKLLKEVKLPSIKYPSGAKNSYFAKDINGNPLDLDAVEGHIIKNSKNKTVYVPAKTAKEIKRFAKKREK